VKVCKSDVFAYLVRPRVTVAVCRRTDVGSGWFYYCVL